MFVAHTLSICQGAICHMLVGEWDGMLPQSQNQILPYKLVDRLVLVLGSIGVFYKFWQWYWYCYGLLKILVLLLGIVKNLHEYWYWVLLVSLQKNWYRYWGPADNIGFF